MKKVKIFLSQFNSPLIYILLIACGISFYLKEFIDAIIILSVIIINGIVGFIQEVRADEALEALKKLSSPHCYIKENGEIKKILSSDIKVNDILILEEGSIIPADGIVLESHSLQVDESSLTGESLRIEKNKKEQIFESTIVVVGHGEAKITKIGKDTEFGKISSFIENKKDLTPLQLKLNDLSKILGLGTIIICVIMFLISLFRKGDLFEMLITSISLAVAAIPEGLMAVVTITLSIGVQKMVNVNTIVKHLPSIETLGAVNVVCSDKTGTITENNMKVEKIFSYNNDILFKAMLLCNNASKNNGDPTEIALIKYVENKIDIEDIKKQYPRYKEIPFDSNTKMMTTHHHYQNKNIIFNKGAFEVIIQKCNYIIVENKIVHFDYSLKKKIEKEVNNFYSNALRVLAFSYQEDNKEVFIGIIGEKDPIRNGVIESIEKLKLAGIKTVMITGDHLKTAKAIGEELKIINQDNQICLGNQVSSLTDDEFVEITVFARVNPLQKMEIVSRYKRLNYVTAMTGDGVNDAPSLKEADVGIAMGKNGTEVARSVSDIILTDDNFSTIEKALHTGRTIYDNIKKSVIFLLSSNLAEVIIMFICLLLGLPLPLIAIHILWVNLISDSLPALALGSDKASKNIMLEPPRKKESSILNNGGLKTTIIYGLAISLITFIAFLILPVSHLINNNSFSLLTLTRDINTLFENKELLIKSRTLAFATLSISELFHMIGMSDKSSSIITIIKRKNYFMFVVLIIGFILQIIVTEIPVLVNFFQTSSLSILEWIGICLLSTFPLVVHELMRK